MDITKEYLLSKTKEQLIKYSNKIKNSSIDKNTYWIRKSKKVVLAMLCIYQDGYKFVPGINIEVSIATGSICAERNAISSALSLYPNLLKNDIQCIAIGSFNLETRQLNPIRPCCVCGAWLDKIWGKEWKKNVISVPYLFLEKFNENTEETYSIDYEL